MLLCTVDHSGAYDTDGQVINPSNLPAGAITTRSLTVHWTGPTQALRLTGWGGSDFFLSYQYDGGPNIALTGAGGLQAVLLVHQHPVTSPATQDTINFRHTVLAYGRSFALPGTSLVVRIKSMSVDRSNITVDICAKSSSQTCAFANDFNGVGPEYLRLRTTANPTWCLAVCSTAAGTECQPAGWAVGQQRAVVLKRNGCTATDDWSLWSVVGSSLRNKATGWCMDASLIGSYDAGWGQPIVAKPCTFSSTQSFTSRVQPGSIRTAWLRGPVYTSRVNMLSSPVPDQYSNGCPVVCTASSAPCNSLLPVASQRGTTGQYAMLTFYLCDTTTSTFNAAPSERYPAEGSCGAPLTMAGLPASGVAIFNPSATTCGAANSWSCRGSRDFLYLLPSSSTARTITLDTCVSGVAAWDSFLYVIPTAIASDDDSSPCGGALSRVTFTAAGGVAYWVVVEGFGTTNVSGAAESMCNSGVSIFNPSATTCGAANSWSCRGSSDFLYLLPSSSTARTITLDTCVSGVAAWDSFLYVIPNVIAFDDDSSPCGGALSRVTFTAASGVAYWVVVEGFGTTNVSGAAESMRNSGVSIFNPSATTCGAANSWSCRGSRDFLYLLPSSSTARTITLDTCVSGVAAWDSFLYVIPTVVAFDDDSSPCGGGQSRITFTAAGGVAYWVLVEGYGTTSDCIQQAPATFLLPSTSWCLRVGRVDWLPPALGKAAGQVRQPGRQCDNWQRRNPCTAPTPHPSFSTTSSPAPVTHAFSFELFTASWPPSGVAIFNPSATTCGAANSWSCRGSRDFLYLLPSSSTARTITLDTCVSGVAAWDSFLYVIPTAIASNDDSSICGENRSRVTFTAAGGVAYWVVVEGYGNTHDGLNAIGVASCPDGLSKGYVLCANVFQLFGPSGYPSH
ncbi:hypothetical protein QJQ45_007366 [Haematococcus lacustris]|nr:hypothetical protein QJQ45_007366 [Haematococcus lacustris]